MTEQIDNSCPHAVEPKEDCVECNSDGSEEIGVCDKCLAMTWHRQGECLRCKKK